jgi:hypothetical protein
MAATRAGIAVAKRQATRSFELPRRLRSPSSTNRLPASPTPTPFLAPALEGFAPTPEMPEIAEAQALLSELSIPSVG